MSKAAIVLLIVLYGAALFAGFLSPYSPEQEFRSDFLQPPSKIHFRNTSGNWTHPYVAESYLVDPENHIFLEGTPIYVAFLAPDLNHNPYLAESSDENLNAKLTAPDGTELGLINFFKETGENTSVFVGMTAIDVSGLRAIIVNARGKSAIFAVSNEGVPSTPPVSELFLLDQSGVPTTIIKPTISQHRIHFLLHGAMYRLLGVIPCDVHLFGVDDPGHIFLLGSDQSGRDIFSRVLYGARISLTAGLIGVFVTSLFGWWLGSIAGFVGGRTDMFLMRIAEVIMAVPGLYLILAVRNVFPRHLDPHLSYLLMIVVLSLTGWATVSRVVRGMVYALREDQFILAVRAQGASFSRILIRHLMPATAGFVFVRATLLVPMYILSEVTLSFFGIGIQEPAPSWGNMLSAAQNLYVLTRFPWVLAPGAFLFLAVLAFNVLGEGLRRKFAVRQY